MTIAYINTCKCRQRDRFYTEHACSRCKQCIDTLYLNVCKHIMCQIPMAPLHRFQALPPQAAFDLKTGMTRWNEISKAWGLNQPCGWLDGAQSKAKANIRLWRVSFFKGHWKLFDQHILIIHLWHVPHLYMVTYCGPVLLLRLPSLIIFFPGPLGCMASKPDAMASKPTKTTNIKQREAHHIGRFEQLGQKK